MKTKILTLALVICSAFAANAAIVVWGGAVSVTQSGGSTTINCGNNPNAVCCTIYTENGDIRIDVRDDSFNGTSYVIAGSEVKLIH